MSLQADNRRGAGLLALGMTLFMIGDTFGKLLFEQMPTGQVICLRNLLAALPLLLLWRLRPGVVRGRDLLDPMVWLRSAADTITTLLYLVALSTLPLADAVAILFASPLLATGLASILGERVGLRRWLALAIGFMGVLLIVQPGADAFRPATLLPLIGAFTMALGDLATRRIRADVSSGSVVLANMLSVALAAAVMALVTGEQLALTDPVGFLAAAAFLLFGYLTYVLAFRRGEVSFVAPFKYAALPAAMALDWLAWGHVPTLAVLTGALLVLAAGLLVLLPDRRAARAMVAEGGG